jgi:hypothetical protein
MRLPLSACRDFCDALPLDPALDLLIDGIRSRLRYLCEVGLGYLTLDRQSRTLSGGEVQRINLTTALGSTLVNALFVLDEPSIGLHPRDMDRVVGILRRLRDQGNSLVVVEHDPQVMRAADRIIDIGPGPGEQGGRILFEGPPAELIRTPARSPATIWRAGDRSPPASRPNPPAPDGPRIRIRGARAHNLKGIDVEIPLHRLVVVTGVSGSGKVDPGAGGPLQRTLPAIKGHPDEPPGEHAGIDGDSLIADVVLLDQSEHRADLALEPGELCRRPRRAAQTLRRPAARQGARLHRRHLQLQQRHRALPDLRRQRLRASGDAVPRRCLSALSGLQRPALSRTGAGGRDRRPARRARTLHRRRAGDDGDRGTRLLRR